jgi:uncharacterized protein (DUF2141 family)
MRTFPAVAAFLAVGLASFGAAAADLRVTIQGVASSSGTLMVALYDSESHFQKAVDNAGKKSLLEDSGRLVGIAMRAAAGAQSVVFTALKPGRYAVISYHDENDLGRLETDTWGVPTEGYCFSNDAEGFLSAPSFRQAAVVVETQDKAITMTLKYPRGYKVAR